MRVLLAGATGEVGHGLQEALVGRGHTVMPVSSRAPLKEHPDVVPLATAVSALSAGKVDLVVNAGGPGDHRGESRDALGWSTQLLGVIGDIPAVLISSTRVLEGIGGTVCESAEPRPASAYGRANAAMEASWLQNHHASVIRLVNFFGAPTSHDSPQTRLLPWSLLLEGWTTGAVNVRSSPSRTKEFIDANDVAAAIEILATKQPSDRLVVAGPGTSLSMRQLAEAASEAIGQVSGRETTTTFGDELSSLSRDIHAEWLGNHGWGATLSLKRVREQMASWLVQWGASIPPVNQAERG